MNDFLFGLLWGFVMGSFVAGTSSVLMMSKHPLLCWFAANSIVQKISTIPRRFYSLFWWTKNNTPPLYSRQQIQQLSQEISQQWEQEQRQQQLPRNNVPHIKRKLLRRPSSYLLPSSVRSSHKEVEE
jgi:hypothetical protein